VRTDDDDALLRGCAFGDRGALRLLYDRWSARLYGIALRITNRPDLAADALQDAFIQVWQHAGRFDPARGSAAGWLIAQARYRALDLIRRHGRETPMAEPPERADDAPDALARLTASAEGAALHRCLEGLDPERRRLVVMAFVRGLSHGELAAALRLPLGTVKSSIRRSLQSLRACLDP
jgi:RNA polymerase sigma-70 factor (ECF subfamily)